MRIEYTICMWMRIFRQNPRTDADAIFEHPHLSGPPPLQCVALPSHDGWSQRCADSRIFPHTPSIVLHLQSCPKNFKFAFAQKNFQMHVPSMHESISALYWSDYDSDTLCTVSDILAAYREGRSLTRQDDIQTGGGAPSPRTHIIIYWLLHDTASSGRLTIPSNRADRQIRNLHRTDQHTPPSPPQ